jgi:hypothetical protein
VDRLKRDDSWVTGLLVVLLLATMAIWAITQLATARVGRLEVNNLSVINDNGDWIASMDQSAWGDFWIKDPKAPCLRVMTYQGQASVQLMERDRPYTHLGLGLDRDGKGFLQYVNQDQEFIRIPVSELVDLIDRVNSVEPVRWRVKE